MNIHYNTENCLLQVSILLFEWGANLNSLTLKKLHVKKKEINLEREIVIKNLKI